MKFGELEKKVVETSKAAKGIGNNEFRLLWMILLNDAVSYTETRFTKEFFANPNYREDNVAEDVLQRYKIAFEAVEAYLQGRPYKLE